MRDVVSTVSIYIQCVSSAPFLSPVGLHGSLREPVGVWLDAVFLCIALCNPPITGRAKSRCVSTGVCRENMFKWNAVVCSLRQRVHIVSISRMYLLQPKQWADYEDESVHSETSQGLHWSQTDALKCSLPFTVTAVRVLALSRKFEEIRIPLILNCYFCRKPQLNCNKKNKHCFLKASCVHPLSAFTSYSPNTTTRIEKKR